MFNHKSFDEANFWFLNKEEGNNSPSKENSLVEKEEKKIEMSLSQQVCTYSNYFLFNFFKSISLF
jgi:hypothetical protein